MSTKVFRGQIWQGTTPILLGRIYNKEDGELIVRADLTSIAYAVHKTSDGDEVSTGTLTINSVVFDTLQTDDSWDIDATGYNFKWIGSSSWPANANETYRYEAKFTTVGGTVFKALWETPVGATYID